MSERWHYRISGKEFGPVSLDLVKTLVAAGTIAPDDEVRNATRSNWILACSASELSGSIQTPVADLVAERRAVRDEWFCRGTSGDVGPLTISDLIQLAADGELKPDEEVKAWADDYWRQVRSIDRLVELLPFSNEEFRATLGIPNYSGNDQFADNRPRRSAVADRYRDDESGILPFPGIRATPINADDAYADSVVTNATTCNPISSVATILNDSSSDSWMAQEHAESERSCAGAEWTGWMGGTEFGPVDFSQLLMWAVTGQLSPMDFVRRHDEDRYVPAVNIPCLFTVRAAALSLSSRQNLELYAARSIATEKPSTEH